MADFVDIGEHGLKVDDIVVLTVLRELQNVISIETTGGVSSTGAVVSDAASRISMDYQGGGRILVSGPNATTRGNWRLTILESDNGSPIDPISVATTGVVTMPYGLVGGVGTFDSLTSGPVNGQTITSAANFTGTGVFASTVTIGAATNPVQIGRLSDSTTRGMVTFNGILTAVGYLGMSNIDGQLAINIPTGSTGQFMVNGVPVGAWDSGGMKVAENKDFYLGRYYVAGALTPAGYAIIKTADGTDRKFMIGT